MEIYQPSILWKKSKNNFTLKCTLNLHPKNIAMGTLNYQKN